MALDQELIAFKYAFQKPHTTPNNPLLANEGDNVGTPANTSHIFGEPIPSSPPSTNFYDQDSNGIVERVRLRLDFLSGTDTTAGRHAFYARLPHDYETSSSNPKKGTYPFVNNQILAHTTGTLQIVSEFGGGKAYQLILRDKTTTQIPLLDPREWFGYAFGGIVYQETPPSTGDPVTNPGFLDCYLYIGKMAAEVIASGSTISGSGAIAFESQGVELTPSAVRVNLTGSGVSGSVAPDVGGDKVTYVIPGEDLRRILFMADCGPFEGLVTSSYHEPIYDPPNSVFHSASIWYTDSSKTQKIIEKIIAEKNNRKQATKIIYKVYESDGVTVKTTIRDIVTYSGITEQFRTRTII